MNSSLDATIVENLKRMLDEYNLLAKKFRKVRDLLDYDVIPNLKLRLIRRREFDPRTYNLPYSPEIDIHL